MKKFNEMSKTKKRILVSTVCVAGALVFAGAGYGLARISRPGIIATVRQELQQQAASQNQTSDQSGLITLEEAKEISLTDAGLTSDQVTFTKQKLDKDDGTSVYDIDFYTAETEYDYEINAVTGAIIEKTSEAFRAGTSQNQQGDLIGLEAAKEIALTDAGLTTADVTFFKEKQDVSDGITVYDIEFFNAETKYEYEINATTGAVVEKSSEAFQNNSGQSSSQNQTGNQSQSSSQTQNSGQTQSSSQSQSSGQNQSSSLIGIAAAKEIALADAGLSADQVTFTKEKQDRDDGRIYYDIEFYTSDREYEYEINGTTGAIVDKSIEGFRGNGGQAGSGGSTGTDIGVDQAKSIALNHAGLSASDVTFSKAKLENDDGYTVYEVEFYHGGMEYDYTIEAYSGTILEYDSDWDD